MTLLYMLAGIGALTSLLTIGFLALLAFAWLGDAWDPPQWKGPPGGDRVPGKRWAGCCEYPHKAGPCSPKAEVAP